MTFTRVNIISDKHGSRHDETMFTRSGGISSRMKRDADYLKNITTTFTITDLLRETERGIWKY